MISHLRDRIRAFHIGNTPDYFSFNLHPRNRKVSLNNKARTSSIAPLPLFLNVLGVKAVQIIPKTEPQQTVITIAQK